MGSQGTVNQTTSGQHKLSKKLVQHTVRIEIKYLYPGFIALINYGYEFGCV